MPKTLDRRKAPLRLKLENVNHYHQRHGMHPHPLALSAHSVCIELLTGGRGWVLSDDQWVEVKPGDLICHQAGHYTIGRSDFENPYSCLAVRFTRDTEGWLDVPRLSHWAERDEVKRFTQEAVALYVDERFDNQHLGEYLFSRLVFQARLFHFHRRDERLPAPLRRVLHRMEYDYAEPLPLVELSELAGWSEPHLHAVFRQHLRLSPHQYLIERRLRAAKERLSSSNAPIKQIAVECGFSSAAAFCAAFRRHAGRTPATYRREQHWLGESGSLPG